MTLVQTTLNFAKRKELTTEQQAIATHRFEAGMRVLVNAFAGTGKTTTCRAVIQKNADKRILYTVFNKAMQSSAAEFESNRVKVCTMHALALAFCRSQAPKARYRDWLLTEDCDQLYRLWQGKLTEAELDPVAEEQWDKIKDGTDPYPTHQSYYFVFCRDPKRTAEWLDAAYDLILVDEAQDTDAGLERVLQCVTRPLLVVGDQYQNLYAFRGTVNALATLHNTNATYYELTHSFRFGPAVAQEANRILELDRIVGLGATRVQHGSLSDALHDGPCTLLCRSNLRLVVRALQLQVPIHIVGNVFAQLKKLRALGPSALGRRREKAKREGDEQMLSCIALLEAVPDYQLDRLQKRCVTPAKARCILSTVHSAKGLEWQRVVVDDKIGSDPQLNYVAVTRAIKHLFL